MLAPRADAAATSHSGGIHAQSGSRPAFFVALGVAASLLAAYVLLVLGNASLALAAGTVCLIIAIAWALPLCERFRAAKSAGAPPTAASGDPDLYLDLGEVEVEAVYVLGAEVLTQLKGGVGSLFDPLTGNERHIETTDVSLTWRCQGRRAAAELVSRLNEWEAEGVNLRLLAARGRCALLMRDDQHWLALPELRIAG